MAFFLLSCSSEFQSSIKSNSSQTDTLECEKKTEHTLGILSSTDEASFEGNLKLEIHDELIKGKTDLLYSLEVGEKTIPLISKNIDLLKYVNQNVKITGVSLKEGFSISSISLIHNISSKIKLNEPRKVLVVRVTFNDVLTREYFSVPEAQDMMRMLRDYYKVMSLNQIVFDIDANKDGAPDVASVTVDRDASCQLSYYTGNLRAIVDGYDARTYDHVIYVTAQNANGDKHCDYSGRASFNGRNQHINAPKIDSIWTHEMGHNLGLFHASKDINGDGKIGFTGSDEEDIEEIYGDYSCIMSKRRPGQVHLNPLNFDELDLLDNYSHLKTNVETSGVYSLSLLHSGTGAFHSKLIKVNGLDKELYLGYRKNTGSDKLLEQEYRGLNIYREGNPNNGTNWGPTGSEHIKTLFSKGESFTLSDLGIRITYLANISQGIDVEIEYLNSPKSCTEKPLDIQLLESKDLGDNTLELRARIINNNDSCSKDNLDFILESSDLKLLSAPTLSLDSGEDKDIIIKLEKLKDKELLKGLLRILNQRGSQRGSKLIQLNKQTLCL